MKPKKDRKQRSLIQKIMRVIFWISLPVLILFIGLCIYGIVKEPDLNYTEPKITGSNLTIQTDITEEEEFDRDELTYYDTIEEAIKHNEFDAPTMIKQKILFQEDNQNAILFFKANWQDGEEGDAVVVYKFAVKQNEAGENVYSDPIATEQLTWSCKKDIYKDMALNSSDQVRESINLNNAYQTYNLHPETTKLQWGLLEDPKAPYLTVDGKAPTEVIPLKLDDDKVYFWYYEDLKTGPVEDLDIEFNKKS